MVSSYGHRLAFSVKGIGMYLTRTRPRNEPIEDSLNRLLPEFPLLASDVISLFQSARNDSIRSEDITALAASNHPIIKRDLPSADARLAGARAGIAEHLLSNNNPTDPHEMLLVNGVRGIKIATAVEEWSAAYNPRIHNDTLTTVLANQVVLSRTGGLYTELRERAVAFWLGKLESELLASMAELLDGAPREQEAQQQLIKTIQRAFTENPRQDHVRALAFSSRGKLSVLFQSSPLSKLWTPQKMKIFSDRLAARSNSTEPATEQKPSPQARQNYVQRINPSAPAVRAVLSFPRNAREHNLTQEQIADLLKFALWS